MKKKILLLLAIAAAGIFVLTACTSPDQVPAGDSTTNQTTVNNSTTNDTVMNDTATNDAAANNTAANQGNDSSASDESFSPEQGEPGNDGEPDGEVMPDEDEISDGAGEEEVNASGAGSADIWSGSYEDSDESVSVKLQEDGNIFFAFTQSGISGIAEVDGTQAIFHGDDYHVVVFNMNAGTLEISVSSEEDFDASASPINGSYKKIG